MLVSELKKVIDIDSRITRLHEELASLYSERQQYVQQTNNSDTADEVAALKSQNTPNKDQADKLWVQHTYDHLTQAWSVYDIKIPAFSTLKKGLLKAHEVIFQLTTIQPKLTAKLGVLLVPPTQTLGQPGENIYRAKQPFINLEDYMNKDLVRRHHQEQWRILVVYQDEIPLNKGKAKDVLADKTYLVGNYDMRGLGVYEYYALTLQSSKPLDQRTWTLLLKGYSAKSKVVASVTFMNGQYRFEVDDCDGVFGDERFRPAIEVAAV